MSKTKKRESPCNDRNGNREERNKEKTNGANRFMRISVGLAGRAPVPKVITPPQGLLQEPQDHDPVIRN